MMTYSKDLSFTSLNSTEILATAVGKMISYKFLFWNNHRFRGSCKRKMYRDPILQPPTMTVSCTTREQYPNQETDTSMICRPHSDFISIALSTRVCIAWGRKSMQWIHWWSSKSFTDEDTGAIPSPWVFLPLLLSSYICPHFPSLATAKLCSISTMLSFQNSTQIGKGSICQCRRHRCDPDLGRPHMSKSNRAQAPQLLSLCALEILELQVLSPHAVTTEASMP